MKLQDSNKKPRLLAIDDSAVIRKAINKQLGEEFDIVLAEDGKVGWDKIRTDGGIQIVLTDLFMPNLDGYGVLQKIRTCKDQGIRNLPVIILTSADEDEQAKEKALGMGATDFLTKPFTSSNLIARTRAHSNYQRATKTLQSQTSINEMTGLMNKQGFEKQLEKDIAMSNRHGNGLTMFKVKLGSTNELYNRFGQADSHKFIRLVGKVLRQAVRKEDTIAHDGLSTFSISLPAAQAEAASDMADRICRVIGNNTVTHKGEKIKLSISIGVCAVDPGMKITPDEMLDKVDLELRKAIRKGRSKFSMYQVVNKALDTYKPIISIDKVLEEIDRGYTDSAVEQIEDILRVLNPIHELLNDAQILKLIKGEYQSVSEKSTPAAKPKEKEAAITPTQPQPKAAPKTHTVAKPAPNPTTSATKPKTPAKPKPAKNRSAMGQTTVRATAVQPALTKEQIRETMRKLR